MISWAASERGFYSDQTLPPVSDTTIDIGKASYHEWFITPYKMAVSNMANATALELYFDTQPVAYVQPYTNTALEVHGFKKVRIVNRGNRSVHVRYVDKHLYDSAPSLYSSVPVQAVPNINDLLFHFDESATNNEGGFPAGIELFSNAALDDAVSKFGDGSLLVTNSGIAASLNGFIDSNNDFTADCWVKHDASGWANSTTYRQLFGIGNGLTSQPIIAQLYKTGSAQVQVRIVGPTTNSAGAAYTTDFTIFNHYALTKKGNELLFFENGTLRHSLTSAFSAVYTSFYVGKSVTGGVGITGHIDEVRFRTKFCQWSASFTPPTDSYS